MNPHFTLTYGLRVDMPIFPDKPLATRRRRRTSATRTDVAPSPTCSRPALGFNWDVAGDGKKQVRGGLGIFAGRPPYVWLSNQYSGTRASTSRA